MILVTNACRTTGSELTRRLSAAGAAVRAIVSPDTAHGPLFLPGVDLRAGELTDSEFVGGLWDGVDAVFLMTPPSPLLTEAECAVVDAAEMFGVRRIVKVSCWAADPSAHMALARWHHQVEQRLAQSDTDVTILRAAPRFQSLFRLAPVIRRTGIIQLPLDAARVAAVDARDVADVAFHALTEGGLEGQTLVVTGEQAWDMHDIARAIGGAGGRLVTYEPTEPNIVRATAVRHGVPGWYAEEMSKLYFLLRTGSVSEPTDTIRRVLGRPARDLATFARDFALLFGGVRRS